MKARVRDHHGTPTLFLDDQPVFTGVHLMIAMDPAALREDQQTVAEYSRAGVHIYALDTVGPHWVGPRPGHVSFFDYSHAGERLREILMIDPDALFLLRMGFETRGLPGDWWNEMYPDEMELLSDGSKVSQTPASKVWQSQVKESISGLIAQLRQEGLYERVIAYQVLTGSAGEWVKGDSSMGLTCGDYSQPMLKYFRGWLRRCYADDTVALQKAWQNPGVDFDSAEVPPAEEQFATQYGSFRDPVRERRVVDFYQCYADMCAEVLLDFCRTIKEETNDEKLAGAFFGYLMELSWNTSFFVENLDLAASQVATTQRSGHLGLKKLLYSPDIDFFVSPYGYAFRGLGGDGLPMQPSESLRLHGKLYLLEEDTSMHNNYDPQGRNQRFANNVSIYQRNFAQTLTHGTGITWLENSRFPQPADLEEVTHQWISRFQEIGNWSLQLDRKPQSEVVVLLDDESFFFESNFNYLDIPLIWQQRVINLNRFGAPHDVYLLDDLVSGRLPEYKLYIFLNAFHLDNHRRSAIKNIIRRNGKVALWLFASGCLNPDAEGSGIELLHPHHLEDLTGLQFGQGNSPWGPFMHILDFTHPITRNLPQDLFWGSTAPVGPVFHLHDPDATILGQVVYSLGRCQPGFGLKTLNPGEKNEWTSIFISTPNIPSSVLRGIARFAEVHLYNEMGDVLYATSELLSVHTVSGGLRHFALPRTVEAVYDLFNEKLLAQDRNQFTIYLQPASTHLFFTGKVDTILSLDSLH